IADVMAKSTPGYRMLFAHLPISTISTVPSWLAHRSQAASKEDVRPSPLAIYDAGKIGLQEEPLDPAYLQNLIRGALQEGKGQRLFAVKNLRTVLMRFSPDLRSAVEQ